MKPRAAFIASVARGLVISGILIYLLPAVFDGSGGRELRRRLAETPGYAYYDQEIVSEIARRTELSEQYV